MIVSRLKKNKKGFTLVELVVGTAILSVIGLTVVMLMTSGTNMYRRVYRRSSVFYKSQISSAQLQEALVDCEFPIAMTDDALLLGNVEKDSADNVTRNIYVYYFSAPGDDGSSSGEIDLRIDTVDDGGNIVPGEETVPFCKHCSSVRYTPSFSADGTVYAVKINMTVSRYGVSYSRNDVISLRNRPEILKFSNIDEAEIALAERLEAI